MQHIEEAGVHSGDSACAIPPHSLPPAVVDEIKRQTRALARELNVKGLMNVQFAVTGLGRAVDADRSTCSRSIRAPAAPCRSCPRRPACRWRGWRRWSWSARRWPSWASFDEVDRRRTSRSRRACFPFNKFPGVDIILGPEMRSTGEVMGIDDSFPMAFAKSQLAASSALPHVGHDLHLRGRPRQGGRDRRSAAALAEMGYQLLSTRGTARGVAVGGHRGARRCRSCRKAGRT